MAKIDFDRITDKTEGFGGADIESVVVEAVEDAFANGQDGLTTENIVKCIESTKSLSDIMKDKIESLQNLYKKNSNFKNAT